MEQVTITNWKWTLLFFFSFNFHHVCYSQDDQLHNVERVYLSKNTSLPNNYFLEISRAFIGSQTKRLIVSSTVPTKSTKDETVLKYYQKDSQLFLSYDGKVAKVSKKGNLSLNIRYKTYELLYGTDALERKKKEDLLFTTVFTAKPKTRIAYRNAQPEKAQASKKASQEQAKTLQKNTKDKVTLKQSERNLSYKDWFKPSIAINRYFGGITPGREDDDENASLSLEIGNHFGKHFFSFSKIFMNVSNLDFTEYEKSILEISHRYHFKDIKMFSETFNLKSKAALGFGTFKLRNVAESDLVKILTLGTEINYNQLFRAGVYLDYALSGNEGRYSSGNSDMSFYFIMGIGWNI